MPRIAPEIFRKRLLIEAELLAQRAPEMRLLLRAELPIGVGQLQQERACGELHPRRATGRGRGSGMVAGQPVGDEPADRFEDGHDARRLPSPIR